MPFLSTAPVSFVAVAHVYIMALEMFYWNTPRGHRAFGMKRDYAASTTTLAANQGLYNGFLSAGLTWGLIHPNPVFGRQIQHFFLSCVAIAGIYGAATVKGKILFIQTVPAVVSIAAVIWDHGL